jgi:hypothetical protein
VAETFFELGHDPLVLSRMTRTGADVAEAEPVQDLAHRALVVGDPEALGDQALQVDPPPAHEAMHGPVRADLDKLGQLGLLRDAEARWLALRPDVLQSIRTALVEAVDPVTQGLPVHAADACRVRPAHPVQDRGNRQQTTALVGVLRRGRQSTKRAGRKICP